MAVSASISTPVRPRHSVVTAQCTAFCATSIAKSALTRVGTDLAIDVARNAVHCTVTAECRGRTGVEMEALTAVAVALLTVYDMCKAVDRGMRIENVRLLEKSGGKSGHWVANEAANPAARD